MKEPTEDEILRVAFTAIALWHLVPAAARQPDPKIVVDLPKLAVGMADEVVKELNKLKESK